MFIRIHSLLLVNQPRILINLTHDALGGRLSGAVDSDHQRSESFYLKHPDGFRETQIEPLDRYILNHFPVADGTPADGCHIDSLAFERIDHMNSHGTLSDNGFADPLLCQKGGIGCKPGARSGACRNDVPPFPPLENHRAAVVYGPMCSVFQSET